MIKNIIDRIKYALKCKIVINIITPAADGVNHTLVPRNITVDSPMIRRSCKSNLRFKQQQETKADGTKGTVYYFTEEYKDGRWGFITGSFHADKSEAMKAHLKLLEGQSVEPVKEEVVLWEGLSKEEAATWINIQVSNG